MFRRFLSLKEFTKTATTTKKKKTTITKKEKEQRAAEKAARELMKKEREERRKAREDARGAREQKRFLKEQERLKKEKEKEAEEAAAVKMAAIVKKLKIDESKYDAPALASRKDIQLLESFVSSSTNEDFVESLCVQFYKGKEFVRLEHVGDEFVIRVEDTVFFFDKKNRTGINFGRVCNSWLDSSKKTPWGCFETTKTKRVVKKKDEH